MRSKGVEIQHGLPGTVRVLTVAPTAATQAPSLTLTPDSHILFYSIAGPRRFNCKAAEGFKRVRNESVDVCGASWGSTVRNQSTLANDVQLLTAIQ